MLPCCKYWLYIKPTTHDFVINFTRTQKRFCVFVGRIPKYPGRHERRDYLLLDLKICSIQDNLWKNTRKSVVITDLLSEQCVMFGNKCWEGGQKYVERNLKNLGLLYILGFRKIHNLAKCKWLKTEKVMWFKVKQWEK